MSRQSQPSIRVEDSGGDAGADPLAGQLFSGKYQVEERLADGGMAIVLRATHVELSCPVAIKLIRPEHAQNDEFVHRLLAEARVVASLRSKHVNRVLDVGRTESGAPFLVLEYLSGDDLATHLVRAGRFPVTAAVDCALQACEGLAEAHALGIVHRDLKPENLFLSEEADGSLVLKVLDFGISKVPATQSGVRVISQVGSLIGTPAYMAPEQIYASETLDGRTDVWALGVVLYELLTGVLPFPGDSTTSMLARVTTGKLALIDPDEADIPPGVFAIVTRCLQVDPDRRFQSVVELAEALAPFGSDQHAPARVARVAATTLARDAQPRAEGDEQGHDHGRGHQTPVTLVSLTPSSRLELERLEHAQRRRWRLASALGLLLVAAPLGAGYFLWSKRVTPLSPPPARAALLVPAPVVQAAAVRVQARLPTPESQPVAAAQVVPAAAQVVPAAAQVVPAAAQVVPAAARVVPAAARVVPVAAPKSPAVVLTVAPPVAKKAAPVAGSAAAGPSIATPPPAPNAWDPKAFGGRR